MFILDSRLFLAAHRGALCGGGGCMDGPRQHFSPFLVFWHVGKFPESINVVSQLTSFV
jgi:hypothetical protein